MAAADEKDLLQRVLDGDADGFGVLIRRYGPRVLSVVKRLVGNPADAEDLAQEVFVQAFTHLHRYDPSVPFGAWLCRIAHNKAVSFLRRSRVIEVPLDEGRLNGVSDAMADELLADEGRHTLLRKALVQLPVADRTLVTLFYDGGWPLKEIAYVLDMPATDTSARTLATRICRLRRRLYLMVKEMERQDENEFFRDKHRGKKP